MHENDIAKEVVDAAYAIHVELGPGLLEAVYEVLLARELADRGLPVDRQKSIPIHYNGLSFDEGFKADLFVHRKLIIELKSIETLARVHHKQLLTYLRLADVRLGLLINFGENRIKDGIHRVVNNLHE